ncbi:hypothetical protein [Ferrimonas lipolytica]|uniref:TM2 domain-containing protein n=1 Tax=Ferrimonas lipolytica TaxID=2724191 RepID=A0A6H1UGT8_9GAMM|nr:hypothetical protein [Ferrimonas lipolytica]QIZ78317.1 hypothetical protein HER31_16275 [Ferrimonas lipolytica]
MAEQGSAGNVIAALASFFFPGLGQLIQGRILPALLFFIFVAGGYGVGPFLLFIPYIIVIPLHIWCIIDAAKYKP